jgi:hypothetical protein
MEATVALEEMSSFVAGTEQETDSIGQACYECGVVKARKDHIYCPLCGAFYCGKDACDCEHIKRAMSEFA